MIYIPETIIQWNTILVVDMLHYCRLIKMTLTLCIIALLEAVMGPSSLFWHILLRLLSSLVRTQLTLIVPHWGPGTPHPQSGVTSPRVRSHSLSRVQNTWGYNFFSWFYWWKVWEKIYLLWRDQIYHFLSMFIFITKTWESLLNTVMVDNFPRVHSPDHKKIRSAGIV